MTEQGIQKMADHEIQEHGLRQATCHHAHKEDAANITKQANAQEAKIARMIMILQSKGRKAKAKASGKAKASSKAKASGKAKASSKAKASGKAKVNGKAKAKVNGINRHGINSNTGRPMSRNTGKTQNRQSRPGRRKSKGIQRHCEAHLHQAKQIRNHAHGISKAHARTETNADCGTHPFASFGCNINAI